MTSEPCDVLVVDDEPVVREAIRRVLAAEGLRVTTVPDAETALAHPALDRCRLVLCDLMLPGGSGLDVLAAVRLRRPGLPIVMISGYATTENAERVESAGATAFLPKPFDEEELRTLVRHALDTGVAAEEQEP
ncbi:MAG TPA: response regulator [Dongiaceae bacterium]|nr:response regulator [Dongiaceae bacterium]